MTACNYVVRLDRYNSEKSRRRVVFLTPELLGAAVGGHFGLRVYSFAFSLGMFEE